MRYKVPNPIPLAARLRAIAREEGTRAALDRVATYGRLQLAQTHVGRAVGFGRASNSAYPMGSTWAHLAEKGVFFAAPQSAAGRHLAIVAETALPQCTKYRVHQMEHLAKAIGFQVSVADQRQSEDALTALQLASHVMFYRLEPNHRTWMYLYEARRLGLKVIYDIDDPVFSVPAISGASAHIPAALSRHFCDAAPGILALMGACDAISVSTEAVAEEARAFLPRPVFVRRNFADPQTLSPLPEGEPPVSRGPGLTLAYASGSDGRAGDLEHVLPVLDAFLAEDSSHHLILIGHGVEGHAGLSNKLLKQISQSPFQDYPLYLKQLAEADAVLVPLADDRFNGCKSAARVLDAAAVARPVLASAHGEADHVVDHGKTGWLLRAPEDWATALAQLADLPDRGASMGRAARARLEQDWTDPLNGSVTSPEMLDWLAA